MNEENLMATSRSRPRYTIAEKLEIVRFAQAHSVRAACCRFSVARSSVYLWTEHEQELARSQYERSPQDEPNPTTTTCANQPSLTTHMRPVAPTEHACTPSAQCEPAALAPLCRPTGELEPARSEQPASAHISRWVESGRQHDVASPLAFGRSAVSPVPVLEQEEVLPDFLLIGYEGAEGGFANVAARRTFSTLLSNRALPLPAFELTGYPQTSRVLDALHDDQIDYAFVATDVLLSNIHHAVLDQLIEYRLTIIGEIVSEEEVSVCALPGTSLWDADCIVSDWLTLIRYEEFILQMETRTNKNIYRQVSWDSATGCAIVQEEQAANTLALCSTVAGIAHGLTVLQDRVLGSPTRCRYTIISCSCSPPILFEKLPSATMQATPAKFCTLLLKVTRRAILDVVSAFAIRGLDIVSFHMRGDLDEHELYALHFDSVPPAN